MSSHLWNIIVRNNTAVQHDTPARQWNPAHSGLLHVHTEGMEEVIRNFSKALDFERVYCFRRGWESSERNISELFLFLPLSAKSSVNFRNYFWTQERADNTEMFMQSAWNGKKPQKQNVRVQDLFFIVWITSERHFFHGILCFHSWSHDPQSSPLLVISKQWLYSKRRN